MPDSKIPYDHTIIQVANAYYQCNQFDKANALVKTLSEKCNGKLTYYLDQKESFISSVNDQIVYNFPDPAKPADVNPELQSDAAKH